MIAAPALAPRYRDLVWSGHSGLMLVGYAALGWALVGLHELGHLDRDHRNRSSGQPER